jgi:hypothetical protein
MEVRLPVLDEEELGPRCAEADERERAFPGRGDRGVGVAQRRSCGLERRRGEPGEDPGRLPRHVAGVGGVLAVVDAEALRDPVAVGQVGGEAQGRVDPAPGGEVEPGQEPLHAAHLERVERPVGPQDLRVGLEFLEIEVGRAQLRLLVGDVAPPPAGAEEGVAGLGRAAAQSGPDVARALAHSSGRRMAQDVSARVRFGL